MRRGFTFVELIITVIIGTIITYSMLNVFISVTTRSVDSEALCVALYLANGKLETVTSKSFNNISSEAKTSFSGSFSTFSSEVEVAYVSAEALDVPVVGTSESYKRVKVWVTQLLLPISIEVTTLVTGASNE